MNLKEIAKAARVSPSTVSLVLNNRQGVGPKTRAVIASLLTENGYTISDKRENTRTKSIRFLKFSSHSHLVNENAGFISAIVDAVEKESRRLGYNLVMTVVTPKNLNEVIELVHNQPLSGVILLATEWDDKDTPLLDGIPVPIVVVDNYMNNCNFSCVDMNNAEAIFSAVRYLHELGHPRIGYLYNSMPSSNCRARKAAYENALTSFLEAPDPSLVYRLHPTLSGSYEEMLEILKSGIHLPSALVATNDSIAIGAIKAMREFGLRIPEDVSIIGFDDIPFSAIADPPLTTMRVSCKEIGIWTVRLLHDHILYPESPAAKIQIGASLIVRKSTCPHAQSRKSEEY